MLTLEPSYAVLGAIGEVSIEEVRANFETNVFEALSVIQAALQF